MNKINNYRFSFFLLPLAIIIFITNFLKIKFGIFFTHDTQAFFEMFKYLVDYFKAYNNHPLWINEIDNGVKSSYLYMWIGSIGSFFSFISAILQLKSIYGFILYLSFLQLIFLFGIYLNLKNNFNLKIFVFILTLFFVFNKDFTIIPFTILFIIFVPYTFFFVNSFFLNFKIKYLSYILFFHLIFFSFQQSYTIIYQLYFSLLIFLIFFIYRYKNYTFFLTQIYIKNSSKDFVIFLATIFTMCLYFLFMKDLQEQNFFNILESVGRNHDLTIDFNSFKLWGNITASEFFYYLFFSPFIRLSNDFNLDNIFTAGSIFIFSILIWLSNKKTFEQKVILLILIIISLLIVSDYFDIFYLAVYNLPFINLTRHIDYIINLYFGLCLIFIYLSFLNLNDIDFRKFRKLRRFFFIFYIILALFFIFKINYKTSRQDLELYFQNLNILAHTLILFYLINYPKNIYSKKITYIFLAILFFFNNFPFTEHLVENNLKLKSLINENMEFSKRNFTSCIKFSEWENKNNFLMNRKRGADYDFHYLITKNFPCKNNLRGFAKGSIKDYRFNDFIENIKVKKLNNQRYILFFTDSEKKKILNISYQPGWKLLNKDMHLLLLENYYGFLKINNEYNLNEPYYLNYDNKDLSNFINFQIFLGFFIFFIFIIFFIREKKLF